MKTKYKTRSKPKDVELRAFGERVLATAKKRPPKEIVQGILKWATKK